MTFRIEPMNPMSWRESFRAQARVIHALLLRDIKTRYFGNGLGFLFASVAWPLVHVLILLVINTALGRAAPFGDSMALFYVTGLIPYITYSYMSRWIMIGMMMNRPLLSLPVVKVTDILWARAILEALGSCLMTITLIGILWLFDIDCMPRDMSQAAFAFAAVLLLGFGLGIMNGVIAMAFTGWLTGYVLIIIVIYISSGIVFVADALPEAARYYLSFNPVLQAVEWMRSAYYDGYGATILDKPYLWAWGISTTAIGLWLERLLRGRLMGG